MNTQKYCILFLLIVSSLVTFAEGTRSVTVSDAVSEAMNNSYQIKVIRQETKVSTAKRSQAKSGYMPKLKLGAGITRFSDVPDIVNVANKATDLNNALDGAYDMLKLDMGTQAQYYGGLAAGDPVKYGQTAKLYKSAYDSASSIASKMSQKEKLDDGLTYYGLKLSLEQPLYTGNKLTSINKQAEANLTLSEANVKVAENTLVFDTKKSFYTVVQAKRMMETAQEAVSALEKHVAEANSYFKAGMVPKLDVIRAETKLMEMQQKLIAAKNGLELAVSAFNFTIGSSYDSSSNFIDSSTPSAFTKPLDSLKKEAIENRAEIKQLDAKIEMARQNVEIAKSGSRPLIAITGEIEQKDTKIDWDPEWSVSLVGTMNIFDGFMVKNQVAESSETLEQAKRGRELLINGIYLDVTQSYLSLVNSLESIETAKKNITQAEEMARMADTNYKAGMGSSMEKIDAELNLTQAKNSYALALSQYSISMAQLEKATAISQGGI